MSARTRPGAVTLVAVLNILLGLLSLGGAGAQGYLTYLYRDKTPPAVEPPPPPEATDDDKAAPKRPAGGVPGPPPIPPPPAEPAPKATPHYASDPLGMTLQIQRFLFREQPAFELFSLAAIVVQTITGLVLLASGIGLFGLRPFARTMMMLFLLWSAAVSVGAVYFQNEFVVPKLERWKTDRAQAQMDGPDPVAAARIGMGVELGLGIGYPLLACVLLMLPGSRTAFRLPPKPVVPAEPLQPIV